MKFLIVLIVIGAFIWGVFNFMGTEVSVTMTPENTNEEGVNSLAKGYLTRFKTGVSLPDEEIYVYPVTELGDGREHAYMVSKMSKESFLGLIEQLSLNLSPNLFEVWPNVFNEEEDIDEYFGGWDVTSTPNEDTYYGKNPTKQIEMAAKYEDGKAFMRIKSMIRVLTDEKGYMIGTEVLDRK